MPLIKTVEDLTRGAVSTAVTAARHPVATTAHVVGFAKGVAGAGLGLVRGSGHLPAQRVSLEEPETPEPVAANASPERTPRPEPELPGPDIVLAAVPDIDDLPEPVVIEADDASEPEAFHHEPQATTRAETIGHTAGDVLEAEDEADEALEELTGPDA